jgi:surface protein
MYTIEHYLKELEYYRKLLINNLREKNIPCDDDEKYNTLIPKVYSLQSNGNIELPYFALYGYPGSEEEIDYILNHIIFSKPQTSLASRFRGCLNLKNLPLYRWDTSKVTNLSNLVADVTGPVTIDAHGCNLLAVTNTGTISSGNVGEINLTDATLSLAAFKSLLNSQPNLTTTKLDRCELVLQDSESLSLETFLNNTGINADLSNILSAFENRKIYWNTNAFSSLKKLEYPIIFPSCYFRILNVSYPFNMTNLLKCSHIDLSNIEITDIPTTDPTSASYSTFYFYTIGTELTDEQLENSVFKFPKNFDNIYKTNLNLSNNKLIKNLDSIYGTRLKYFSTINIIGTNITEIDYSKFTNIDDATTGPNLSTFGDVPKLERYINNIGYILSFNARDKNNRSANLKFCPSLKYIDLSNNTIRNLGAIFRSPDYTSWEGYESPPEDLEEIYFDNCIFDDSDVSNMRPYAFSSCKKLKIVSFKNAQFPNGMSSYSPMYYMSNAETMDLSGADFTKVTNMNSLFSYSSGTSASRIVNLSMADNLGKSKISIYKTLSFAGAINITKESILDVFDKVYDLNLTYDVANGGTIVPLNIVLPASMMAQITPEEIAIATNKGWTVS